MENLYLAEITTLKGKTISICINDYDLEFLTLLEKLDVLTFEYEQ